METAFDILIVNQDFKAESTDSVTLQRGDIVEVIKTSSETTTEGVKKNISSSDSSTTKWLVRVFGDNAKEGWVPRNILDDSSISSSVTNGNDKENAEFQKKAVIRELLDTEEEFGRDLQNVVDRYIKAVDGATAPRTVRDSKDIIFGNFQQIAEFHNMVFIDGVKYNVDKPNMVVKTFLRLERDFDMHVKYCKTEPAAQEYLASNQEASTFFQEISNKFNDEKSLSEHLKLPIQRINDYHLLLKDLLKFSLSLKENIKDIQKALELMLSVPSRAYDSALLNSIEGLRGNISKLGRLLLHDWWTVSDSKDSSKAHERYLFLFKSRILICKVRKLEKRSVFVLQEIVRLPECVIEDLSDQNQIRISAKPNIKESTQNLPIYLKPHNDDKNLRTKWYTEICSHLDKEVTLQEHKADDLRIDASQILEDTTLSLPQKAEAYRPDTNVKASDVAKDHFLSKEEKERYQSEYQELLRLEQESIEKYNKTKLESYKSLKKTSVVTSNQQSSQEATITLPPKVEAHSSEGGIRPSDVAKDHFLTKEEKERYQRELQELLRLEQEQIEQYNKSKLESYKSVQNSVITNQGGVQQSQVQQRTEEVQKEVTKISDGKDIKTTIQSQKLEEDHRVVKQNNQIVEERNQSDISANREIKTEEVKVSPPKKLPSPKRESTQKSPPKEATKSNVEVLLEKSAELRAESKAFEKEVTLKQELSKDSSSKGAEISDKAAEKETVQRTKETSIVTRKESPKKSPEPKELEALTKTAEVSVVSRKDSPKKSPEPKAAEPLTKAQEASVVTRKEPPKKSPEPKASQLPQEVNKKPESEAPKDLKKSEAPTEIKETPEPKPSSHVKSPEPKLPKSGVAESRIKSPEPKKEGAKTQKVPEAKASPIKSPEPKTQEVPTKNST